MADDTFIHELDADAGWDYAKLVESDLAEMTEQRNSRTRHSAYQQPKVDGFNRICLLLTTVKQPEALVEGITEIVKEQNAKAAAIERAQMAEGKSPRD
jgi:hypothetical protein